MKILLIAGHGAGDPGAIGNGYKEADLTRELVRLISESLTEYQVDVDIYNMGHNAFKDAQNGTLKLGNYDYLLEVHFNAYNDSSAHGTEIFVTTAENGIEVEQAIMNNLKRYFTLRDSDGVKKTDFLVIKTAKNQGISSALLETCFITNKNDMIVYTVSKKDIAEDIAQGIATGFGLKRKPVKKENTNIAVVKFLADDGVEYYLNVYASDKLEKLDAEGRYNYKLTIGTTGARNCFIGWNKNEKIATGTVKGAKTKGTKLLVRKVATVK